MYHPSHAYLPADRLAALASQRPLPERASGSVLSVDIVGFTRITESLAVTQGARRGADALAELLNRVYTALIAGVESWGGAVVSFSGDAMRCWFPADDGRNAIACASQIQRAVQALDPGAIPAEWAMIAVKAAIVSGMVLRLSLGDPAIQLIDTLAGDLLSRLADLEKIVQPGEIVIDEPLALALADLILPGTRRRLPDGAAQGVVVDGLTAPPAPAAAAPAVAAIPDDQVRPWLLPAVWDRLQRGMGDFLTELRSVVALFGQFGPIDVESGDAIAAVNRYVGWVQGVIARYDGVLLQITLGEKGNYFYAAFGALPAHEDDPVRTVCAARDLQAPPAELALGAGLRVGLAGGIMRTGAYGSPARRTYGSLGDAANLAARLMQRAAPGAILASAEVAAATADQIGWADPEPITVKGKRDPISVYRYDQTRGGTAVDPEHDGLPLVGRQGELAQVLSHLDAPGRLVAISGEAGVGKSRLISAVAAAARRRGWWVSASECQSYHQNTPYSLWQPMLRQLMGLDESTAPPDQIASLERALASVDPRWLPRLPLLGPLVGLSIPDNDLTRTFDAQLRNASREALVVDWLRGWALAQAAGAPGIVLIFEDVHWIDPLSLSLLAAFARVIGPLPLVVLLAHRPLDAGAALNAQLRGASAVPLEALSPEATSELIAARLAHVGQPADVAALERLAGQVYARTQGNPFYAEELLAYLHGSGLDPRDPLVWERGELPTSLHQLLLSRIDQLTPTQQETLKMASVIGRLFRAAWLEAYDHVPAATHLRDDLGRLRDAELILLETVDPELTYLFRHVIAQEVAYESLGFAIRARLHEQLAGYLERSAPALDDQRIYLLAYHYERGANRDKQREYLLLAGRTAQAAYANAAAIGYYERALPLLDEDATRSEILLRLGEVYELVADKQAALERYEQALDAARAAQAVELMLQASYALGVYYRIQTDYARGLEALNDGYALAISHDSPAILKIESELANIYMFQGDFDRAKGYLNQSLHRQIAADDPTIYEPTYYIISQIATIQGDFETAHRYAQKIVDLNSKEHDIFKYSTALNNLANALANHGVLDRCIELYEETLNIRRAIGAKRAIAVSLYNGAQMYLKKYDLETAASMYREALDLARSIADAYLLQHILRSLGITLIKLRMMDEAKSCLDEALAICETIDSPLMLALLYNCVGTWYQYQNDLAQNEHFTLKTLALYEEMNDVQGTFIALYNLGSNALYTGRLIEAREYFERGMALHKEHNIDEKFMEVVALHNMGFITLEEGNMADSISVFKTCLALTKQIGDTEGFMLGAIGLVAAQLHRSCSADELEVAAAVISAVEQTVARIGTYFIHYIQGHRVRVTETIRQSLPADQFAAAWERGQSLSMEEAIDHALAIGGR